VLTPDNFKGVGYQTRFLQSVLNGEVEPPMEKRKGEVKVMKNPDAINQVLNSHHLEEEEKVQMDKHEERKAEIIERMRKKVSQNQNKSGFKPSLENQSLVESFLMLPPGTFIKESSHPEKSVIGIGMNYSHSELENQDGLEDESRVENSALLVKNGPKKKKKLSIGHGFQVKSEDFPELGGNKKEEIIFLNY